MADTDWAAAVDEQEKDNLSKQVVNLNLNQDASKTSPSSQTWSSSSVKQTSGGGDSWGDTKQTSGGGDSWGDTNTSIGSWAAAAEENQRSPQKDDDEEKDAPTKAEASLINKILRSKLVTTKADLEVQQNDPNSPLYSVKRFEDLRMQPEILNGIFAMGFNSPSKIQETALPQLLANPPQNMIAQSQSGTGKTAAFVITMLSRTDTSLNHPQCLCLTPTYELALQIGEVVTQMSKYMSNLNIRYSVRGNRDSALGIPAGPMRKLSRGEKITEQIIIGTPGTTLDWCLKFKAFDLKKINVFVLDEADVMIDQQGHQDQSIRIQKNLRPDCQMLLFSATYDTKVMRFAEHVVPEPIVIKLRREEESLDNIKQYYIMCNSKESKFEALGDIYGTLSIGQSMIFCHTRRTAGWLAEQMVKEGHAVGLLSGELDVQQRAAVINRFREGKEKVLITTNVSARGIDVEQVTVVVNFDLPVYHETQKADCETYLHRIGRTGRFGKSGVAINFIDGQRSYNNLQFIEKHFGRPIEKLEAGDIEAMERIQEADW